MFTGIITATGKVEEAKIKNGSVYLRVGAAANWKLKSGDSVSIDGICSTITRSGKTFEVEYMPETIKKTTAGFFKKGMLVNLERPLRMNDFVDGHFVQGHVDATRDILDIKKLGNSVILKIGFPPKYRKLIAEKGSITVNGVSLTVVNVSKDFFTVSLVSYTLAHTNLRLLKKGSKVNLEFDMFAKYMRNAK